MLSKEIKTTCEEIKKYQNVIKELRELEAHEKLNLVNLKADLSGKTVEEITLDGKKFADRLYSSAFAIGNKVKENNQSIQLTQKLILTDDRIHKIALSVYTKGDAAFDAFAQKPTPKWHELNYKRDYNEEKNKLLKWQNDVLEKEKNLAEKLEIYEREIQKPEHIAGIKEIETALKNKNEARKEYLKQLKESNRNLKYLGRQFLGLSQKIMPQFSYKVDKEAAGFIKKSNLANQDPTLQEKLESSLNKLKAAVNKTRDERVKGGMRADLNVDVRDNGMEI